MELLFFAPAILGVLYLLIRWILGVDKKIEQNEEIINILKQQKK
jgi:hypothetical protein